MISTAVIPVAGLGTRLFPISKLVPKEALPLGRNPAIDHIVGELIAAGMNRIIIVVSPKKMTIADYFQNPIARRGPVTNGGSEIDSDQLVGDLSEVEFFTVVQEQQLGLGHAILCAEPVVGNQPFAVGLGDCLIGTPGQPKILPDLIREFKNQDADFAISFEQVERRDTHRYGIAKPVDFETNERVFEIDDLVEKPEPDVAPSNLAICGRYVFSAGIFDSLKQTRCDQGGEIQLTHAITRRLSQHHKGIGVLLAPGVKRYDVGDIKSYVESFLDFALEDEELGQIVKEHLLQLQMK